VTRLTVGEIDTLIEAVGAWEHEPSSSGFVRAVLEVITSGQKPGGEAKLEPLMAAHEAAAKDEVLARKRVGTRLEARLLDLRDEAEAAAAGADGTAAPIEQGGNTAPGS
jgi:hypothetical protein